jgi:hypothetical protein
MHCLSVIFCFNVTFLIKYFYNFFNIFLMKIRIFGRKNIRVSSLILLIPNDLSDSEFIIINSASHSDFQNYGLILPWIEGLSAQLKRICQEHVPIFLLIQTSSLFTENWDGDGHPSPV